MRMGVYLNGNRLKVIVYFSAEEKRFLFKNAPVVNNTVVFSRVPANGGEIIIRRSAQAETNGLKITASNKDIKDTHWMTNLGPSRLELLRLKNLHPHKSMDIPATQTVFNSIPALVTRHADWMIDPVIKIGPKEREKEPLYNPQDHPAAEVILRHPLAKPVNGHGHALGNVSDLKTALELVNSLAADGVEFFVENGKVRAKMITVL